METDKLRELIKLNCEINSPVENGKIQGSYAFKSFRELPNSDKRFNRRRFSNI